MASLLLFSLVLSLCSTSLCFPSSRFALLESSSNSSSLAVDLSALLLIKSSLLQLDSSGLVASNLSDWTSSTASPCSWSRINCTSNSSESRVSGVDLSFLKISGELIQGFSKLTGLSYLNLSHNNFTGAITQDLANCTQLASLDLSSNRFSTLPSGGFSRFSNLQVFALGNNRISASVSQILPKDCGQLGFLNLSGNFIREMSSYAWQNCSKLQFLDLRQNSMTGSIASSLTTLSSLQQLLLSNNQLSGSIPDSFCSSAATSLWNLDLSNNSLSGTFPLSTTNCYSLQQLHLSRNNLTGNIPTQIGNYSSLEFLDLSENFFLGPIPSQIGNLVSLRIFMAGTNNLSGPIPSELGNCENLTLLDLNSNLLEGNLDLLGEILSLQYLVLHSNAFSGPVPLALLTLSNLKFLDLSNNSLQGSLPAELANLTSLQFLILAANTFSGSIPAEIGNMSSLQFLDLSSNQLGGSIPPTFGKLQNLLWLMLAYNRLTGSLPRELGSCTSLLWFNVRSNELSGELPSELASMGQSPQKIFSWNAEVNKINPPRALGECLMIKRWIPEDYPPFNFTYDLLDRNSCRTYWIQLLTGSPLPPNCSSSTRLGGYFQITDNLFTGSLPETFQGNHSTVLLLALNRFTGNLPDGLGRLPLIALNVSHNNLSGPIPSALGNISCLNLLDMSYNNLTGSIPQSLVGLHQLTRFNVSYNPLLSGNVPAAGQFLTFSYSSYKNDSLLCFQVLTGMRQNASDSFPLMQFCDSSNVSSSAAQSAVSSKKLSSMFIVIGIASCLGILSCGALGFYVVWKWPVNSAKNDFLFFRYKMTGRETLSKGELSSTICLFRGKASSPPIKQLTYADILIATNNFDEYNVVGRGGFGVVYKADLADGSTVAIKKLEDCGVQGEREFMAEMETLGTHAHENLVPLLACCIFGSERLLVYKFLSNGSLDDWLHEKQDGRQILSWSIRLRIACGCAKGLRYLHHSCSPVLIHRDMKASNILLDDDFEGYLTDFGLAREVDPGDTHVSTMIAGTLGYVPPEYCQTWRATTKGDVYSFGVVLLELITGRRPVCPMDCNTEHVVDWVRSLLSQCRATEAYDPVVQQTAGEDKETVAVELLEFLELARACTEELPEQRPSMREVANTLEKMQQRRAGSELSAEKYTENDAEPLLQ